MPRRHESPPKDEIDLSKSSELTLGRLAQTRVQLEEGGDQPSLVQEAKEGRKKDRVEKPETLRGPLRKESQNDFDLTRAKKLLRSLPRRSGVAQMVRPHRL